jgi:hypothetical protein
MGKGDKFVQNYQKKIQMSTILKPWENRPLDTSWSNFYNMGADMQGQAKLANDLISKKKHR